jgi:hypothetical protein
MNIGGWANGAVRRHPLSPSGIRSDVQRVTPPQIARLDRDDSTVPAAAALHASPAIRALRTRPSPTVENSGSSTIKLVPVDLHPHEERLLRDGIRLTATGVRTADVKCMWTAAATNVNG